ncbi:unnamed protein product, partial [Didymodactylos carnosus]
WCMCALEEVLRHYTLGFQSNSPPRFIVRNPRDIGFYVRDFVTQQWKVVNNATWYDWEAVLNDPQGIYNSISRNGKSATKTGLDPTRSAYLGDVWGAYNKIRYNIENYYRTIIEKRSMECKKKINWI